MRILWLMFLLLAIGANALAQSNAFEFNAAEKLGSNVNSEFEESAPFFIEQNGTLYFTRALHPENEGGEGAGQDIWMSSLLNESTFSVSTNEFPTLNNQLNNAVIGASPSGKRLFLLSTYQKKLNLQKGFSFSYAADGITFPRPSELPIDGLSIKSDFYGGSVHLNGGVLLISMESKNTLGEEDLYVSLKVSENEWSKPLHLGATINSAGFEISPFLSEDQKTLFFASNGHGGLGGSDIFFATRLDSSWTNWSEPQNLGAAVNSIGFDAFPFITGEWLYFSSNRGGGMSDIYRARNSKYFVPVEAISLAFLTPTYTPKNISVSVMNEQDEELGVFRSDTSNVVQISGLAKNQQYKLVPQHDLIDAQYLSAYVLNDNNEPVEALEFDESGEMTMVAKPKAAINKRKPVVIPQPKLAARGVLEFNRTPLRYLTLALIDASELVSQYTMTDEYGAFAFAEAREDQEYFVQVITDLNYIKDQGDLYFTDAKNKKLFKAKRIRTGIFEHQQLTEAELAQLSILKELQENGQQNRKAKPSEGVFKYKDLPKEGVTLYLVDENDNVIETVTTDADGKFVFKKLRPDQNFSIKVADAEDTDLNADGLIYFLDSKGNEVNIMQKTEDLQTFVYEPLSPDLASGLRLLEEEDMKLVIQEQFVFTAGVFKYENLPRSGITLTLLDENDNPIETVTTDENGQFIFSMLREGEKYSIKVEGIDAMEMDQTQIYLVGNEGRIVKAEQSADASQTFDFNTLQPDYFFSLQQINNGSTQDIIAETFKDVEGVFRYANLPKDGVMLYLVDENDNIIDSVITSKDGSFKFQKLARDVNYSIRLAAEDEGFLDAASLYMASEDNETVISKLSENGSFDFRFLPRGKDRLSSIEKTGDTVLDVSMYVGGEPDEKKEEEKKDVIAVADVPVSTKKPVKSSGPELLQSSEMMLNNELKNASIFFAFNSVRLSDRDRFRLNREVVVPARKSGQPVLLLGYSCDLGSSESNLETSKMRAEAIKAFLIGMGIPESQIEVHAIGDSAAQAEDLTPEQRVLSRRVDVFHLAP